MDQDITVSEEARVAAADQRAERDAQAKDDAAWAQAQTSDTFEAFLGYLKEHPDGTHRVEAVQSATGKAKALADESLQSAARDRLVAVAPEVLETLPPEIAILYVGPPGMRVKDILAMRHDGLGDEVIRAKIASGNYHYKDFALAELATLKKLGVSDTIVRAMIESHAAAEAAGKQKAERESLRKEIAALREMVEKQQASGAGGTAGGAGPMVQTKEGPMDKAACMVSRLGALKLCEQVPWPGSTVCKSTAEASFPCDG